MTQVAEILSKASIVQNLARKKFIAQFTLGLIKSRNMQFSHIAQHLNDQAKVSSNEVRIQDFFPRGLSQLSQCSDLTAEFVAS